MFELMKFVCDNGLNNVTTQKDFLLSIGYNNYQNISNVKNGQHDFRLEHFMAACEVYEADANFFFTSKHSKMFRNTQTDPIMRIKEAVQELEAMRKKR